MNKTEDQIILIDKPTGVSSFGAVARIRQQLKDQFGHKIKVGHTGTLDPFATGLLILLSGKMTKKSNVFLKQDKEYEATIKLGFTSTTGDPEGEIAPHSSKIPNFTEVETVVKSFVGNIAQTVPKFSAVKINGQRAYKLARQGTDFTPPTRQVTIYDIEILGYRYPYLQIRTKVSSGTYIRTLGENIGQKLGTGAYLTALRRTKIANYSVNDPSVIKIQK